MSRTLTLSPLALAVATALSFAWLWSADHSSAQQKSAQQKSGQNSSQDDGKPPRDEARQNDAKDGGQAQPDRNNTKDRDGSEDSNGNQADRKDSKADRDNKNRRRMTVTPAEEAAVLALVRQHHPEVESLLEHLKRAGKPQYAQAVRSLFRTSVRLAAIQERDSERYELELQRWKLGSQAQLLALKVQHSKGEEQQRHSSQLAETVEQLRETKIALATLDRDRLRKQLSDLESRIESLRQGQADAEVEALLKSARNMVNASRRPKQAAPPAAGPVDAPKTKRKPAPARSDAT